MQMVNVKYIGNKETHADKIFGTGLIWAGGESHPVPLDTARKMAEQHSGVYELEGKTFEPKIGKPAPAETAEQAEQRIEQERKDEEARNKPPLIDLNGLDKKGLQQHARQYYNLTLPGTMNPETMRAKIVAQANGKH